MLIRSGRIPFENVSQLCAYWGISYQDTDDEEQVPQTPAQARSGSDDNPSQQQVQSSDTSASRAEKVANKTPVQHAKQTSFTTPAQGSSSNKSHLNADSLHTDVTTSGVSNDVTTRSAATASPHIVSPEASNAQSAPQAIVAPSERSKPSSSGVQGEHMVPGSSQDKSKVVAHARMTSSSAAETEGAVALPQAKALSVEVAQAARKEPAPSRAVESGAKHGYCREQLPNESTTPKEQSKTKPKVAAAQGAEAMEPVNQGPVDDETVEATEASNKQLKPSVSTEPATSTTPRGSQKHAAKATPKEKLPKSKATVQIPSDEPKPQGDTSTTANASGVGQVPSAVENQPKKGASRAHLLHSAKKPPNTQPTRFRTKSTAEADKVVHTPVTRSTSKSSDPAIPAQLDANLTTNVESASEQPKPSGSGKKINSRAAQPPVDDKSVPSLRRSRPNTKSKTGPKRAPKSAATSPAAPVGDTVMPAEVNPDEVAEPDSEQSGPSAAAKKASARRSPVIKARSNPRPARSNTKAKTVDAGDDASNKSANGPATKAKNPPTPKKTAVKVSKADSDPPGPSSSGNYGRKSPRVYHLRSRTPKLRTEAPAAVVSAAAAKPVQKKSTNRSAPDTPEPTSSTNHKKALRSSQKNAAAHMEAPPAVTVDDPPVQAAASVAKRRARKSNKKSQGTTSVAVQATDGPSSSQNSSPTGARMVTRQRAKLKTSTKEDNVGNADAPARRPRKRKATTSTTEAQEAPAQEPVVRTRAQKAKLAAANDAKK